MAGKKDIRSSPRLVLGLGCERGTNPAEILSLVEDAIARGGRSAADIALVTSIETRTDEPAIAAVARHLHAPMRFFPASVLET